MSNSRPHLIRVHDLPLQVEEEFFPFVLKIENAWISLSSKWRKINFVVTLVFFEPSTRTRMSFQMAAQRMGLNVNVFEASQSSLSKGESMEDTLLNLDKMQPDIMVVRGPDALNMEGIVSSPLQSSVINGGWGTQEHPTQALLDAYTLWKHFGGLRGLRVLIMGDLKHSRVASSHLSLLKQLGCEVGVFGPPALGPKETLEDVQVFESREKALRWAQVCMLLRVQRERHESDLGSVSQNYLSQFGLCDDSLKFLDSKALILHPGPVNKGVEISEKAYWDSRSKILEQVQNGLYVRMALFDVLLNQRLAL